MVAVGRKSGKKGKENAGLKLLLLIKIQGTDPCHGCKGKTETVHPYLNAVVEKMGHCGCTEYEKTGCFCPVELREL